MHPEATRTQDPRAFSKAHGIFAVESPEVLEVLDCSTGRHELHSDVIGDDWEKALQLRLAVQTNLYTRPRFLCSVCSTPTYLVCRPEGKKLFFRHTLEDGRCSAVTRSKLSKEEIDARKYNGAKESWLHREMKRWIVECMEADGRFSNIEVERPWSGALAGGWRKPDVRAIFEGLPIAFEIQLSTTYISVIAQRREFYLKEGGLLFWVFSDFDVDARRLTQDDIFYNNNRNAFIVNSRTRADSIKRKCFLLDCVWATPTLNGKFPPLKRDTVRFDALTLDQATQRAYFFDFDRERLQLVQLAYSESQQRLQNLRDRFETLYLGYHARTASYDVESWWELRWQFEAQGLELPDQPGALPHGLFNAMYSAKHGKVLGWDYSNFIQVAHHVEPGLREHLQNFRRALKAYNRSRLIRQEDHSGKWAAKVVEYKARIRANDPAYRQDTSHDELIEFLFPEVAGIEI